LNILVSSHFTPLKQQVSVQPPTAAVNVTLLAFAAERRAAGRPQPVAADRYLLPSGHQAANPPHAAAAVDTDGQTDGRTPDRHIDFAPLAMRSVNNHRRT